MTVLTLRANSGSSQGSGCLRYCPLLAGLNGLCCMARPFSENGSPDPPLQLWRAHTVYSTQRGIDPKRELFLVSSHIPESSLVFLAVFLAVLACMSLMIAPSRGASVLLPWETWGVGIEYSKEPFLALATANWRWQAIPVFAQRKS